MHRSDRPKASYRPKRSRFRAVLPRRTRSGVVPSAGSRLPRDAGRRRRRSTRRVRCGSLPARPPPVPRTIRSRHARVHATRQEPPLRAPPPKTAKSARSRKAPQGSPDRSHASRDESARGLHFADRTASMSRLAGIAGYVLRSAPSLRAGRRPIAVSIGDRYRHPRPYVASAKLLDSSPEGVSPRRVQGSRPRRVRPERQGRAPPSQVER